MPRMDLLKDAAIKLVEILSSQASQITYMKNPVQFSVVPFAGSVNVGPDNDNAVWIDTQDKSSMHQETEGAD
ncbi:hypothetical protein H7Q97_16920 [Ochrobactrum sp. CM-21-5]|nr:hypothetical protein [Ochrobactrum sp. CM-21-5]MBC2887069.1 hypothetical protein [Ochrobactrum sp. CM-21-5]